MDNDDYEKWCQTDENVKIVEDIKKLYRQIHELTEQKFQLVPLLPTGVLANWLLQKCGITTSNQYMNETFKRVWDGLTHRNKMKLLSASNKDSRKVANQQRQMDSEINELKEKIISLSLKLNSAPKKNTCEYFEGEEVKMEAVHFKCAIDGCFKTYATRCTLMRHQRNCHQTKAEEMISGINAAVSDSPQVQGRPVVTQSQKIPLVQPSMGYKRPALNAEVVKPSKTVCTLQPLSAQDQNFHGFPSDAHYRANLAHRQKFGKDRPYARNPTLLCDCPDMRPAVLNTVTHTAGHILNRGANYFWCSRKAIKKVGEKESHLSPQQLAEYKKKCNFFVFEETPKEKAD